MAFHPKGEKEMKVGILCYSETGHTLYACEALAGAFRAAGHAVQLAQITVHDIKTDRSLKDIPAADGYDYLVIGTPVQGGTPPPPVQTYLRQIRLPPGQPVGILITQFFPWNCLGGTKTLSAVAAILSCNDADIRASGIIHWSSRKRAHQLAAAIETIVDKAERKSE